MISHIGVRDLLQHPVASAAAGWIGFLIRPPARSHFLAVFFTKGRWFVSDSLLRQPEPVAMSYIRNLLQHAQQDTHGRVRYCNNVYILRRPEATGATPPAGSDCPIASDQECVIGSMANTSSPAATDPGPDTGVKRVGYAENELYH